MKTFLISSVFVILSLSAAAQNWTLDKAHSSVVFSVDHMVISETQGKFTDFDAELTGSKDDFSDVYLKAVIKVSSVDTDNRERDAHLRRDEFFDVSKYPEITFEAASFKKIAGNQYEIPGKLTIRGITKNVVFKGQMKGPIKSTRGGMVTGLSASTTINRQDYGVAWRQTAPAGELVVGDMVSITINAEFTKN
jgi:polyisoprenoid-binding protein YceI